MFYSTYCPSSSTNLSYLFRKKVLLCEVMAQLSNLFKSRPIFGHLQITVEISRESLIQMSGNWLEQSLNGTAGGVKLHIGEFRNIFN